MSHPVRLHPTLWRTCRVLASRTRMRVFHLLMIEGSLTVSEISRLLKRPLSVASESARALEARGLLTARRVNRRVSYRLSRPGDGGPLPDLVRVLRRLFQEDSQAPAVVFREATAFTHPRRVSIYRVLSKGPATVIELRMRTRISARALRRHLQKLMVRGFVKQKGGYHTAVAPPSRPGRLLAALAGMES